MYIYIGDLYALTSMDGMIYIYKTGDFSIKAICKGHTGIFAFIFCIHNLCLIGRVYVFYVGHVGKSSLYETLFHCNILSKHHLKKQGV
jgi:uncharacterized YccA/Bax inhibitor family protein